MFVVSGKIIIIFSGYNDRAIIAFIRTLEKYKIRYAIIARNEKDLIFKTSYKDNVEIVRESHILDLKYIEEYVNTIKDKHKVGQCFIVPSTEALNRFLQKRRTKLEKMGVIVPLSDAAIYVSVSDKKSFGEICKKQCILVPDEYKTIEDASFPFVAKPRKYVSKDGSIYTPFLIFNKEQKDEFLEKCDSIDFYYQEYVEGDSIYLLYYFHRNGRIFKFSQENIIQQSNGRSMVAAITSNFHNSAETIKYEKLFKGLGFFGLIMVELKVNNDKRYMIEANPRFWGPSQLFVDADMNFFEAFLHDYGFLDDMPDFHKQKKTKYFWFGGICSALRENSELTFYKDNKKELLVQLDTWMHYDIFKRPDTIGIFREEMK